MSRQQEILAAKSNFQKKYDVAEKLLQKLPSWIYYSFQIDSVMELLPSEYKNWLAVIAAVDVAREAQDNNFSDYEFYHAFSEAKAILNKLPSWILIEMNIDDVIALPSYDYRNWLLAVEAVADAVTARNELKQLLDSK